MGATNCPETPRQRLIGMMYLVLTALLALNVSKDILDAFVVVDETLETSTRNTEKTIDLEYSRLVAQKEILGEAKVHDALASAKTLRDATNEMVNYIIDFKSQMLIAADNGDTKDGNPKGANEIESKDDYSNASNFFILQGNATKLKNEVLKYRNTLLSLVPETDRDRIKTAIGLNVDQVFKNQEGQEESWEVHNFEHTILIACFTLLNKMVGEVRNAEATILKHIIAGIGAEDYKFDKVRGRAIPDSRMVFSGENYEADVIVAAYDSKSDLEIYYKMGIDTLRDADIASANKLVSENGVGRLKIPAGGNLGDQKYAGIIRVRKPDGTMQPYGFKDKYTVIKPSATVAADKMNVLYSGIENPVSISAPVDPNRLSLSIPGCTVTPAGAGTGKYVVTVPASLVGRGVTATVTATSADNRGQSMNMGITDFRVKQVPTPKSYLGATITGGKWTKNEITANALLTANMGQDFLYELTWTVTSYKVIFVVKNVEDAPIPVIGNRFNDEVIRKINSAQSGTVIIFTDIKAKSTAGERPLSEITVRIR